MTSPDTTTTPTVKSVQFSNLTIMEFNKVLDDTPACNSGPAVRLADGKPVSVVTRNIDLYEFLNKKTSSNDTSNKSGSGRRRNPRKDFYLSPQQRTELFLNAGYSMEEVADAIVASQDGRKLRQESLQQHPLGWDRLSALLERGTKKYHPKGLMNGIIGMGGTILRKTDTARSA